MGLKDKNVWTLVGLQGLSKIYGTHNITTWTWHRFFIAESLWDSNKNPRTLEVFYGLLEAYGNYNKNPRILNMLCKSTLQWTFLEVIVAFLMGESSIVAFYSNPFEKLGKIE